MALRKCPKCELNYILDDQALCSVCIKELKGIDHHEDEGEICPICGEREVATGEEYCAECLADMKKLDSKHTTTEEPEEGSEETEQLETIEGIEDIPIVEEDESVPPFELENINEELDSEDEPFFDEEGGAPADGEAFPEEADGDEEDEESD